MATKPISMPHWQAIIPAALQITFFSIIAALVALHGEG
jgi:hypothetical protein